MVIGGKPGSFLLDAAGKYGLDTADFNIMSDLSLYYIVKISRFIKRNNIDIVISRDRDLSVVGPAARLSGKTPVIARYGLALRSSFRKHSFLLGKFATGVITNTISIKDHFENNGIVRQDFVKVIYNGVNVDDHPDTYGFSNRFKGRLVILTVARLASQKGYHCLIDAISMLKRYNRDIVFVFVGTGKLHARLLEYSLKKEVSGMIHFEGFVRNAIPYLRGCDIFVLPSLYEGMPNAAMEAMACGKPVVMTDVDGARELVPDDKKGILIPPKDPPAIADAIEKLVQDKKMRETMGGEAAKFVRQNFSYTRMIDELEEYLKGKLDMNLRK